MKRKFYFKENLRAICFAFIGFAATATLTAQEYADSTGLVADIEAGIYEEYILAPASVTDTFFIRKRINPTSSFVLRAKEGLGFKPVVTGNLDNRPGNMFLVEEVVGGAEIELQGIKFVGSIGPDKSFGDGILRIQAENIDIIIKDCEFHDFPGYNTIAKVYNSGGDITLDNVLTKNTAGKIIQINYKDDDSTPNYVPKMGDLTITNSTFIDNYKRIFFELGVGDVGIDPDDPNLKQRFNAGAENITIDHCTFFRHEGVNVMQGRSFYEFAGDMAAVEGAFTLTNTIFAAMDQNLNADSASVMTFDSNYFGFGVALEEEEIDDLDAMYGAVNTFTTVVPVFADTADGAWDLTLQNEVDLIGNDGTPIGDPRWWTQEWFKTSVESMKEESSVARVFAYSNRLVIEAKEFKNGQASIFNITGQLVNSAKLSSSRTEIELPLGLYIVKVNTNLGHEAAKVFIGQ
jgi:hypothetical protein